MHGPPLVGWLLVVVGTTAGMYCLLRARSGAAGERRAARGDAVMGLGMAAMAAPVWVPTGRPWGAVAFAALFAAAGAHALVAARRGGDAHRLHHAVGAFAMVYMALAMAEAPGGGHGGAGHPDAHHPAGTPLLTGLLLVYFAVYVVRTLAAIVPLPTAGTAPPGAPPGLTAPSLPRGRLELTGACRVSMGIGMLAMLLTM
ncbi:DUF5134 domain-containing protein [Streptomyces mobaraensis NBRC 13819 = DSM 40847]|uniref:Integral membrane protein n=1 Tax=Streptomyces mobaraensis (strain ATCC 29032 / DSM 40847 / JCM 4168 / NBRC 13819 / NCIMB 11159 / IPCR 16-22) TaxID=1223523 RepID=M3CDS4_STRM1|nr:DUF5134 domain-containing protein [Streptomyces mobaraensis]EMF02227.1 hypothetical protein H340_01964 [Streptomyces mobaraensis NBRC 13819 = DSM 40847]QTT72679.1 DUF5134 domain-containing protein [Streptomyces mobaraensis NBRC 13819 = DSM 40847]